LALDLFVVIVAVDSRWLIRALEVQYGDMLNDGRDAVAGAARRSTAQDYLEKIFQITYALAPMQPGKFGDYVDALTASPAPRQSASSAAKATASSASPDATGAVATDSRTNVSPSPSLAGGTAAAQESAGVPITSSPPATDGHPDYRAWPALEFSQHEKDCLKTLVAILPTPRMAKRLVNVYRLVKATRPLAVATKPQQHATLFLLAVLFGRPSIASELLRALFEKTAPFDKPETPLAGAIGTHAHNRGDQRDGSSGRVEWETFGRQVAALCLGLTVGDCALAPEILARYSLVTGHEWHAWSAPKETGNVANGGYGQATARSDRVSM
jgi:hypothetical protein